MKKMTVGASVTVTITVTVGVTGQKLGGEQNVGRFNGNVWPRAGANVQCRSGQSV